MRFYIRPKLATTIAAAAAVVVASLLSAVPAYAAAINQNVDDTCQYSGSVWWNPYYYATGPSQYWSYDTYSGGPDDCTMWTWNEPTYCGETCGNSADWYLAGGDSCCPSTNHTGNYSMWAYIPPIHAFTTSASYQIWDYGHILHSPTYVCSINQANIGLTWVKIDDSNVASCNSYQSPTSMIPMCAQTASPSCGAFVELDDATGESYGTTQIGYDNVAFCKDVNITCPFSAYGGTSALY